MIKEYTGHTSDCVRQYKKTSENLLRSASETLAGQKRPHPEEGPPFTPKLPHFESAFGSTVSAHGRLPCKKMGECSDMCEVLKKNDETAAAKKSKKFCLSLKWRKGSDSG